MRPSFVATAVVAQLTFAAVAGAQSLPKAIALSDWERGKANVLAYIAAAPDSMMGFHPTPGVRTFAQQIGNAILQTFLVERIDELSRIMQSNIVE